MYLKTKFYMSAFVGATLCFCSATANALETTARNVILTDYETGQILYAKDHKKMVPPASMSKLMTVYILFSKLKDGSLSLDDTFVVSENAWRKGGAASGGSTMFLKIGEQVRVEDLIKGIIIQSGNDACIVTAENLAGSEDDFAVLMNQMAKKIGMHNSSFANATGLPDPNHRMSVEDLSLLAGQIIREFPAYYYLFSQKTFTHNGITQGNRNPLLYSMSGADGLKTGHTEEAGFSLTASVKRGDRRLIEVMTGTKSIKERSEESGKIMSYGFREFDNYDVLTKGQEVARIPVWFGTQKEVALLVSQNVKRTIKKNKTSLVKMTAVYQKPIKAPITKGMKLGVVKVEIPGQPVFEVDLVADRNVAKLGFFGKITENLKYLLLGEN